MPVESRAELHGRLDSLISELQMIRNDIESGTLEEHIEAIQAALAGICALGEPKTLIELLHDSLRQTYRPTGSIRLEVYIHESFEVPRNELRARRIARSICDNGEVEAKQHNETTWMQGQHKHVPAVVTVYYGRKRPMDAAFSL